MKSLFAAIQFLTTAPLKPQETDRHLPAAMACFPVVGLIMGLVLAGVNCILGSFNLYPLAVNVILVIVLIIMTGGLHLDGLADTFDALLSGKSREEMLDIMRDPHIGTMGVLSVTSILLLKISLLSSIAVSSIIPTLITMCVLSRWAMTLSIFLFPYARQEGKAGVFIKGKSYKYLVASTAVALVIAVIAFKLNGLLIFGITAACTCILGSAISSKLGGTTGDVLGATDEVIEVITLVCICAVQGAGL